MELHSCSRLPKACFAKVPSLLLGSLASPGDAIPWPGADGAVMWPKESTAAVDGCSSPQFFVGHGGENWCLWQVYDRFTWVNHRFWPIPTWSIRVKKNISFIRNCLWFQDFLWSTAQLCAKGTGIISVAAALTCREPHEADGKQQICWWMASSMDPMPWNMHLFAWPHEQIRCCVHIYLYMDGVCVYIYICKDVYECSSRAIYLSIYLSIHPSIYMSMIIYTHVCIYSCLKPANSGSLRALISYIISTAPVAFANFSAKGTCCAKTSVHPRGCKISSTRMTNNWDGRWLQTIQLSWIDQQLSYTG